MDVSCGPSNALSSLSKHADRDVSHSHPHLRGGPVSTAPQFRRANVDPRLNHEFAQFANSTNISFSPLGIRRSPIQSLANSHAWVQDFSDLSLSEALNFRQNGLQQTSPHQSTSSSQKTYMQQIPSLHTSTTFKPIMNMRTNLSLPMYPTEHREMHATERHMNLEREAFEHEFNLVEAQLDEGLHASTLEMERGELAETARRVEESLMMNSPADMAEKLEQSSFLKLMTQLSSREMELNGDRFVSTASAQDSSSSNISVRYLPDPLAEMRQQTSHLKANDQNQALKVGDGTNLYRINLAAPQVNTLHLPDPLSHIADGSLDPNLLSLEAARVISNDQVSTSDWMEDEAWLDRSRHDIMHKDWQEIYDDYRHDDDAL